MKYKDMQFHMKHAVLTPEEKNSLAGKNDGAGV